MLPQGYVTGGWEFVGAAYGITGTLLTGYLVSLIVRLRAEARAVRTPAAEPPPPTPEQLGESVAAQGATP